MHASKGKDSSTVGVEVILERTPNGGDFSVGLFSDAEHVPVSKDKAFYLEIHECDENGDSIHRTYGYIAVGSQKEQADNEGVNGR